MIYGIGIDILEASRIPPLMERFQDKFARRILMPVELEQYRRSKRPARFLANRFAGKEAIVKAMGTGFAHGVWVRDVGVVQNSWGKPEVVFSPRGDALRKEMGIGDGGYVTLTDDAGLIVAVAILMSAMPHQVVLTSTTSDDVIATRARTAAHDVMPIQLESGSLTES